MPDRVKQAVFGSLGAHYDTPGLLPALRVADVFAGSGSMGLEALSRGAAACWFFERGRTAIVALRENITALCEGQDAHIVTRDAWAASAAPDRRPFDLILLDPPYADSEDASDAGQVVRFLDQLEPCDGQLVLLHHRAKVIYADVPTDGMRVVDRRRFGTSGITVFSR